MHPFLERDSWPYCRGELVETDQYELTELLTGQKIPGRRGILGRIAPEVRDQALRAIESSPLLAPAKLRKIQAALRAS